MMLLDSYAESGGAAADAAAGFGCWQHPQPLVLPPAALQQHPHQQALVAAAPGSPISEQLRGALQLQVALQQMLLQTMQVSSERLSAQPCSIPTKLPQLAMVSVQSDGLRARANANRITQQLAAQCQRLLSGSG
jgi:hypothetical protein